jgi:hypothetical protein
MQYNYQNYTESNMYRIKVNIHVHKIDNSTVYINFNEITKDPNWWLNKNEQNIYKLI